MPQPLVSVIVPTKNSDAFLEACLRSVRAQTYPQVELIVVDNHSTDRTRAIAERFADKVFEQGDERSSQRNYGVQKAGGEYVLFVDSDMELSPEVVAQCVAAQTDKVGGVIIPEESFGEGFWSRCKMLEKTYYRNVDWMEAARFFRVADVLAAGGYDELRTGGEDWDLSGRMELYGPLARIPALIHHNEGRGRFWTMVRKKFYYGEHSRLFQVAHPETPQERKQRNPFERYYLFFSDFSKICRQPLTWLGMIVLKTCEFGAAMLGILKGKL